VLRDAAASPALLAIARIPPQTSGEGRETERQELVPLQQS
jgi:hypothetical protein